MGATPWGPGGKKKLDQIYDGITQFDNQRILTEADGTPKEIDYDTSGNVIGDQFYQSLDKQKSLFFEEPLTGECDHKARRFVDINEQYMVTVEGSPGTYEQYVVNGEPMWVLKEGTDVQ